MAFENLSLDGRTAIVTGSSRGIGAAIARRLGEAGCNVVVAAKTVDDTDQKLKGTIHSVAEEVEELGGNALAFQLDAREESVIEAMVEATVEHFGGLDILVNNAGAIKLLPVAQMPVKRFDLLWQLNVRAPYACAHHCVPHLRASDNAHIVNMSPPISLETHWLSGKTGYTISKYGMSMLTMGLADEVKSAGIAVNSLWPRTTIATAAVEWLGGESFMQRSRKPEIMADAVYEIVSTPSDGFTGQTLIDEELLRERGVEDFEKYAYAPGHDLMPDFYIEE